MITHDHNHSGVMPQNAGSHVPLMTLGDLHAFVGDLDLPSAERATIRSAIKRADALVGHGLLNYPASPQKLFAALDSYSPAMAGTTAQAFANLKSRVRKAFRLARPHLQTHCAVKLTPAWAALRDALTIAGQRGLSRFMRFSSSVGWELVDISDTHMQRFAVHLSEEAMVADWEKVVRNTIKAWNGCVALSLVPSATKLTTPPLRRTSYWVSVEAMSPGLRADMENFLDHIAKPKSFANTTAVGLKDGTVLQYRHMIITLVSAIVASGVDLAELGTLRDVVIPERLEKALVFLHARAGDRVTAGMMTIACRARRIAIWCGVAGEALEALDGLIDKVKAVAPRSRGMTAKNRALLDRLDDPRFRDLVYTLPHRLWRMAGSCNHGPKALSFARSAIAIELLLTCSMRRANLVELELGKSIRKLGEGQGAVWIIEYEEEDVKNAEPLRYTLPPESAEMLERYLRDWWPRMSSVPTAWLFPRENSEPIDGRTMAADVASKSRRILGEAVTPHQFRHVSTELYLRENPCGMDIASQHLGHRDPNTTRTYYAKPKQQEASRVYQQRMGLDRSEALRRIEKKGRVRRKKPGTLWQEDVL